MQLVDGEHTLQQEETPWESPCGSHVKKSLCVVHRSS